MHSCETALHRLGDAWDDFKSDCVTAHDLHACASALSEADHGIMQHLAQSLCAFIEKSGVKTAGHQAVVQTHLDAMFVACHDNIRDHGGPAAEELKLAVARAIRKCS